MAQLKAGDWLIVLRLDSRIGVFKTDFHTRNEFPYESEMFAKQQMQIIAEKYGQREDVFTLNNNAVVARILPVEEPQDALRSERKKNKIFCNIYGMEYTIEVGHPTDPAARTDLNAADLHAEIMKVQERVMKLQNEMRAAPQT